MITRSPAVPFTDIYLTDHSAHRMAQRGIDAGAIESALRYGRKFYSRDAVIYVIGRRETLRHADQPGFDCLNGLHVVCSHTGCVITVYKNKDFHRKQFPNKPRRSRRCERR